ncbi:MAG: hypothetical protein QXY49_07345 [Thermofilaceae archaeon]
MSSEVTAAEARNVGCAEEYRARALCATDKARRDEERTAGVKSLGLM